MRYVALCYYVERSDTRSVYSTRIAFLTTPTRSGFDNIYVTNKYYKMSEEELELLCQEDEAYVQAWRSSLTNEQLNQLNEYIA